jgi:hypothetical protein
VIVMAKSARKKADAGTNSADRSSEPLPDRRVEVTHGVIARRAYELYTARGREHGHDVDDWLQAERELRHAVRSTAA